MLWYKPKKKRLLTACNYSPFLPSFVVHKPEFSKLSAYSQFIVKIINVKAVFIRVLKIRLLGVEKSSTAHRVSKKVRTLGGGGLGGRCRKFDARAGPLSTLTRCGKMI